MPSSARRLPLRGCKLPIPPSVDPIPGVVYALRGAALEERFCDLTSFPTRHGPKIAWVHVPKSGTSFMETVLNYACRLPHARPSVAALVQQAMRAPPSAHISEWSILDEQFNLSAACFAHRLLDHGRAVRGADGQIASWRPHVPGRDWAVERGHVVALFREPTQRLLSAWHQAAGPHGVPRPEAARLRSPTEYARYCSKAGVCVEHKLTQYLIGRQPHSWADVQEAAAHIERRDVLFVGLTELWNLSVCAFHRQLGGTPQPAEFAPSRQYNGSAKGSSRYFASELPGYYDEYDEYVYEWARSRFVRDVQNLTGWRCAMERWEDGDRLACAE